MKKLGGWAGTHIYIYIYIYPPESIICFLLLAYFSI